MKKKTEKLTYVNCNNLKYSLLITGVIKSKRMLQRECTEKTGMNTKFWSDQQKGFGVAHR